MGYNAAQAVSSLAGGEPVAFQNVSMASFTGFIASRLKASVKGQTMSTSFVMNLPVQGMPEGRDRRILEAIVSDTGRFFRYLLFLIADGEDAQGLARWLTGNGDSFGGEGQQAGLEIPLLEELVRTFSRNPGRLDRIAQLVDDLRQSEQGRSVLPDGFERAWPYPTLSDAGLGAIGRMKRFSEDIDLIVEMHDCSKSQSEKRLEVAANGYTTLLKTSDKTRESSQKGIITSVY